MIDDEIEAKKRELAAAVRQAADLAYQISDAWRAVGDRWRDGDPPEVITARNADRTAAAYTEALVAVEARRKELAELGKVRRRRLRSV